MLARLGTLPTAGDNSQERLEKLIRADYERCHPEDMFEDLKRRARFSKEDKGLLRDWMCVAARRQREQSALPTEITRVAAE